MQLEYVTGMHLCACVASVCVNKHDPVRAFVAEEYSQAVDVQFGHFRTLHLVSESLPKTYKR